MKYLIILVFFPIYLMGMGTPVYQYRIYCITEGKNVYTWGTTPPTKCPNNTADTVNLSSVSIVDEISSNVVKIQTESVPTGGFFKAETFKIIAATGATTSTQVSWPFNISLSEARFVTTTDHQGDLVSAQIPSNMTIGAIVQNVNIGDTTLYVPSYIASNVAVGFYIAITDGTNSNDMGRIIAIDTVNNILTMETAPTNSYSATTPTYINLTVSPIHNLEIGPPQEYVIGQSNIGSSHIPANTPITVFYVNNGNYTKTLIVNIEYLY